MRTQPILWLNLFTNLTFPLANEGDGTNDKSRLGKLADISDTVYQVGDIPFAIDLSKAD